MGLGQTCVGIAGSCCDCVSWNLTPSCAVISLLVSCPSPLPNANKGETRRLYTLQQPRRPLSELLVERREAKRCSTLSPQILLMVMKRPEHYLHRPAAVQCDHPRLVPCCGIPSL